MKQYEEKCKALRNVANVFFDNFLFVTEDEERVTVAVKGTAPDLLYMVHELVMNIRAKLEDACDLTKEQVDELTRLALLDTDELIERYDSDIPSWMKKYLERD